MSEYKKCGGCGAKYNEDACPYCTIIVVERDELPEGILLLSNVTRREWEQALKAYHASEKKNKRMVLFGLDPSRETKAQYIELKKCPK